MINNKIQDCTNLNFKMSTNDYILKSLKDGVRQIKFNRPKKRNALCSEMYVELTRILNEDAQNDAIVVTILSGIGDYFSSGNDLTATANVSADSDFEEVFNTRIEMVREFLCAFINYPKLLIAVVNGPAIGVGTTMLALCDVVYASNRATFSTPFIGLGMCPEGCSSYLFPRIMGRSKASEMLLLGKTITAEEALQFGLVSKMIPHEDLDDLIKDATKYGTLSVNSVKLIKHLITRNLNDRLHEVNVAELKQLKTCFHSEEMFEALARFAARKSKL